MCGWLLGGGEVEQSRGMLKGERGWSGREAEGNVLLSLSVLMLRLMLRYRYSVVWRHGIVWYGTV